MANKTMIKQLFFWNILIIMLFGISCQKNEKPDNKDDDKEIKGDSLTENWPKEVNLKFDTLSENWENPWGIAFLEKNVLLITERAGKLFKFNEATGQKTEIAGVPNVFASGQGGLLDVALHPDYQQNGRIYFSYSKPASGGANTAVAFAQLSGESLTNWTDVYVSPSNSNSTSGVHFGSRLVFDKNGFLFISIGERGQPERAQNLSNPNGKILRINDDGSVPADNPFVGQENALPEIWCYGIRNPQGMVLHPNGTLWEHEHGPKGGDELNIVIKGANYGWPLVTYGVNYNGSTISEDTVAEGINDPIYYWSPSIAPCGMAYMNHPRYGQYTGKLWIGALAHRKLQLVSLNNDEVTQTEDFLVGLARFRDVKESPNGFIYVVSESPELLLKLVSYSK